MIPPFILYFLVQLANALILGALYALIAVGLTLIFGILKIVNFAHGELYMLGAYSSYYICLLLNVDPFLAVVLSMAIVGVIGCMFERVFVSPMYSKKIERKDEYAILVTFGLSIFLQNLAVVVFGPWPRKPPSFWMARFEMGFIAVSGDRLADTLISAAILSVVVIAVYKTMIGRALRAVSQDRHAASIVGINPSRMSTLVFGVGSALAAAAGALIAPIFLVVPDMGTVPVIKGFVIIVLGGMGSLPGSIMGALVLGLIESLSGAYIPDPRRAFAYKDVFGLIVLILVLLFRPSGLLGEKVRKA